MPIVSVIIPVYNTERYLRECIDSVLAQTLTDIEVFCIDDASPDGCPGILDDYASRDPRVSVVHLEQNRRQGYGRNLGLTQVTGDYVYFLDSDDAVEPHALETLWRTAERDNLDAVFFDSKAIFDNEELRLRFTGYDDRRQGSYTSDVTTGHELFDAFHVNNEWSVLVQRQFWNRAFLLREGISFPAGAEHEDQLFSIANLLAAQRVRYLPEQLLIRRFRPNSVVTTDPAPKNFHGYFVNTYRLLQFLKERNIAGPYVDKTARHLMELTIRQHPVFAKTEDPARWFATDELVDPYLFFDLTLRTIETLEEEDRERFFPLASYDGIALYGAGRVARSIMVRLSRAGFYVSRCVVTSTEGNPEMLGIKRVIALDDFTPAENEIVLVAMAKGNHATVSRELASRGITHYCYAQNVLTGPF